MKKIFITLLVIIFVFLTLFASVFGIRSFYIAQTKKYNMQQINVCITQKELWDGRNPTLTLYTQDDNALYEISSVWYEKFDIQSFDNNFISNKEYTIIVNRDDIAENTDIVYVYGILDEQNEYLSSEDAVSAEKSNSFFGLAAGLLLLIGIVVLMIMIFINKKAVVDFLKEFYNSK